MLREPMRRGLLLSAVLLLLLTTLCAQNVQMSDGRILLATVENADADGLRVRRLDNGGSLDLRWDQLSTASAMSIKRAHNLVGDVEAEPTVRADEVEYSFQGTKMVIVGRIVETDAQRMIVQKRGVPYPVRRADLRAVRKVDAPVSQVLTKDEYYTQLLVEMPPGDEADRHIRIAELLILVRDYGHAGDHLQKARELGNSRNPQLLTRLSTMLERYKEAEKELGLLEQIQAAIASAKPADFERGAKLIAQYDKDFPQKKLKAEFESEKKRFTEVRTRTLSQLVASEFRRAIAAVAEKKIDEPGTTLDTIREYAQGKMTDDIIARLATQMKLDAEEVKALWAQRERYPVGKRAESFDYGIGSWVLGEQAIGKGTDPKAAGKPAANEEPTAGDRESERFRKAVQDAIRNRQRAIQQAGGGEGQEEQTEEGWWQSASRLERVSWARAFYAEFGGQLVLRTAYVEPCMSCYGAGNTLTLLGNGKPVRNKCQLCHGLKYTRNFKAY